MYYTDEDYIALYNEQPQRPVFHWRGWLFLLLLIAVCFQ